jgi:hypothetical protein
MLQICLSIYFALKSFYAFTNIYSYKAAEYLSSKSEILGGGETENIADYVTIYCDCFVSRQAGIRRAGTQKTAECLEMQI